MSVKDRFLGTFESLYLGVVFAWMVATAIALIQPVSVEHHGSVEIYALTAVPSAPSI